MSIVRVVVSDSRISTAFFFISIVMTTHAPNLSDADALCAPFTSLSGNSGTIGSGNVPWEQYSEDTDCAFEIIPTLNTGESLKVTLTVDLELSPGCANDYVRKTRLSAGSLSVTNYRIGCCV